MVIFKKNSRPTLDSSSTILLGSTLYPVVLRDCNLGFEKITKRVEFGYMLKYSKEMGYDQLLPKVQSLYLPSSTTFLPVQDHESTKEQVIKRRCIWKRWIVDSYSCQRQIKPDEHCIDEWYGFVGRWSNNGKYLLIMVMFFGRLKNFNKTWWSIWKLS
ncbi:hypothetical protein OSB04_014600 [Centaurea solstitialis]|uniref:Uncharacterized protein n=1 Tax=Centaurea solstitialis TaxID=347529 RepID=A0AA38T9D4_9ASTR|nr:hypothetical protein OSB04_014600 [Centaurea solstitialis]